MYKESAGARSFNALIYGDLGTGKTNILKTARLPVFVHSFDKGGTKTLEDEINEGKVLVDSRGEDEDSKKPSAYRDWEKDFNEKKKIGFFDNIGTYSLDSITSWGEAVLNAVMKSEGRAGGVPILRDWMIQMYVMRDAIKLINSLPCDCILIGHLDSEKDEVTGKLVTGPMVTGKLKARLPLLFDEIYVTLSKETSKGIEYSLLTRNSGFYKARTRLGRGGKFDTYEVQDIKALLKKADMLIDDLPLFV